MTYLYDTLAVWVMKNHEFLIKLATSRKAKAARSMPGYTSNLLEESGG